MGERYVMQTGTTAVCLAPEFESAQEADTWANERGIFGTPITVTAWAATPTTQGVLLADAKRGKLEELNQEGDRRCALISPLFRSVDTARAIAVAIKPSSLSTEGANLTAVALAWANARTAILALPTLAAVDAYNVVTGPAWP